MFRASSMADIKSLVVFGDSGEEGLWSEHLATLFDFGVQVLSIHDEDGEDEATWRSFFSEPDQHLLTFFLSAPKATWVKDVIHEASHKFHWWLPSLLGLSLEKLRLDSLVFSYDCNDHHVVIKETYTIKGVKTVENRLYESSDDGEVWSQVSEPFIWRRRSDLKGLTLTNSLMPYSYLNIPLDGETPYRGFVPDLLSSLQSQANFKVTPTMKKHRRSILQSLTSSIFCSFQINYTCPADGNWGGRGDDGQFNGLVGQLSRREVDFTSGLPTVTLDRSSEIDFTVTLCEDFLGLVTSVRGQSQVINTWVYINIFERSVWFMGLLIIVLLSLGFMSISHFKVMM